MAKNVLGTDLSCCCSNPMTGFYRTGYCTIGADDHGLHTVCAVITADFLNFSAQVGNDLSTPHPEVGFPGLQPGDKWCLCVQRWVEAYQQNCAPQVVLKACHISVIEHVSLEVLKQFAFTDNSSHN